MAAQPLGNWRDVFDIEHLMARFGYKIERLAVIANGILLAYVIMPPPPLLLLCVSCLLILFYLIFSIGFLFIIKSNIN